LPHDAHEGITVSADAYTVAARAKDKFGKANPLPVGILPIEVFFTNSTNLPVKLDLSTIQLEVHPPTGSRQSLDWLEPVQVATSVAHPHGPPAPKTRRFPVGPSVAKDAKRDKLLELLKPLALNSEIVPPMGGIHGFLFFDVSGNIPGPGEASLYIPDLSVVTTRAPLMFFEVALGAATTPAQ